MTGKEQEIVKTTLRIPRDVLDRAKIRAIQEHISLQELILKALQSYTKGGK
jgi:predicted HicB family RNase H-like nuclease